MLALCVDILSRSTCTKCVTPIPSSLFPPFLNPQMPCAPQIAFLLSHLSHPVLIDALCIHIYRARIPFLIFVHITFQRNCALRADGAPTVHIVYFVQYIFPRNRTSSDLCILKFKEYYPIEHIFVPACSSAWKIHFFQVLVIFKL